MAYATYEDVQARLTRTLTSAEQAVCSTLLDDAAAMIDATGTCAIDDVKKVVSCRMVIRALNTNSDVPVGATQGSISALGYAQSWTIGAGGASAELYLSKADRQLLGVGNSIGSYSPTQYLVPEEQ